MPDVDESPPFTAYQGDAPYLFVSYAHKDGRDVFQELKFLNEQGYRIWYDEGIDPGNEWPEEIAKALAGASLFLVFITPVSVNSKNVRNEINFALNNDKPFLAIHLTETDLPPGLALRMGDIQAILKVRMIEPKYREKLEKSLPGSLRTPPQELEIQQAVSALRRVIEYGEAWVIGGVDVSRSEDRTRILASMPGEIYPGHVRDLIGWGWEMEGRTGPGDLPQGCHQSWAADGNENSLRTFALRLIAATKCEGYSWQVHQQKPAQ